MRDPYNEHVRLSPNIGGKIRPKFIILHHTSGNYTGSVAWCLDPKSKVSYHYIIDPRDGSRTQLVWDTRRAWHAGISSWKGVKNLNAHSVGIAFDRDTNTRTPSTTEIDSCAHKCIYLMEKFGLEKDAILTHAMISPKRKNDTSAETHELVFQRIDSIIKPEIIMPKLTLQQRIENNILLHPDRTNQQIAKNTRTIVSEVERVRRMLNPSNSPVDVAALLPVAGGVTLSSKRVLPRKPPESAAKFLKRLPKNRGFSTAELAVLWGMAEESIKRHARELGCFKYVEVTEDEWVPMVMHPDTAAQY